MIITDESFMDLNEWVLPAVVIGFKERIWDAPELPWLVRFQHQYAGYACQQEDLTGVLLPLLDRADAAELVEDLRVLGCDSPMDARIRARPDLAPLHLCSLEQYEPEQRVVLDRVLAKGPPLPRVIGAAEALVEFDANEPLRFFAGWQLLSPELPRSVHLADPLAPDTSIGPIALHAHQRLDDRLLHPIRGLRPGAPLRVFLVWGNSD